MARNLLIIVFADKGQNFLPYLLLSSRGRVAGQGESPVPPGWGDNLCPQGSCPDGEKK